jgi:tetratricopeptide (TPR) repeat protein
VLQGDLAEAARVLERAASLCREWNLPLIGALISGLFGLVRARSGRLEDGVVLLQEAVAIHEHSFGRGVWHTQNMSWLAEALLLSNRLDEARKVADQALALIREGKHRVCEPWTLRLLGEIAARADDREAEGHFARALALAEQLGMRPLVAHCHLDLGKLYRRAGRQVEAHERLVVAAAMCRDMQMQGSNFDVDTESRPSS